MSLLGFNTGYVEELYKRFLDDPSSVSESWREFFTDYDPGETAPLPVAQKEVPKKQEEIKKDPPHPSGDGLPADAEVSLIRGPGAAIVDNMEASLRIPTATSVRTFPVKLLAENRTLLNQYQRGIDGFKVSFTHIIAYAIVQALKVFPTMFSTFVREGSKPKHVRPSQVNFGLAIDIERRGRRSLLVPNIKGADQMNFAQFLGTYNELIRRSRGNALTVEDFHGTNVTLTNPGMIGTSLSVPRLMPHQGVIVGIGSIGYPPEYQAISAASASKVGLAPVMTVTSTYDHRVIQGAESGAFLAHIADLLQGNDNFYSDLFEDLHVPYPPFVLSPDSTPRLGSSQETGKEMNLVEKQAQVMIMIRVFRVLGHLQADTNPLQNNWKYHSELDPAKYGLTVWDLDREFVTGGLGGKDVLPLRDILNTLRETYTRRIGVAYMHLSSPIEKHWLQEKIETLRDSEELTLDDQRRILLKLNKAEAFERFLHTRFIGHKRFSLEGGESIVPMLDLIVNDAAEQGVHEVVIGMTHRGRLNILANIIGKSYENIFSEFEGNINPDTIYGSGDVKYHLGSKGTYETESGAKVELTLASNPSHLESITPIVQGMVRAKQDCIRDAGNTDLSDGQVTDMIIPVLIHGDAAFAGQGVVAETLNCSQLRGYHTGGTIHLVINNQIGFTTGPSEARSSTYATDVARMIEAPIFHVNGDDPEACVRVARLALDYRQVFNKDIVVDMLCYRQHGHNEGDEPTYTNPVLYQQIQKKRSPRKLYTESLLNRGAMKPDEAEKMLDDFRALLQDAFERTSDLKEKDPAAILEHFHNRSYESPPPVDTRASEDQLENILHALLQIPDGFNAHPKLMRQFERRNEKLRKSGQIDWAFAEALAFGTLLQEGTTVRLSGQDSRRATFSQRHAVIYDQITNAEYIPLNHITEEQARLHIYDSLLSEYAVAAFEYGYSVQNQDALVIWEAQFGDFANGAQIVFDQFLSAAEEKWGQTCSLVALLPHGYEGQGPEHSSARLERFLQLCAEGNMMVCNLSTPANYFHALRQQVLREVKKPLVLMTPKSLLRHPKTVSPPKELTEGEFLPVIGADKDPAKVKRIVVCSGKIYYDLLSELDKHPDEQDRIALIRLEQYYPWPHDALYKELERYNTDVEICWAQEEPANMGAWTYARPLLKSTLRSAKFGHDPRVQYAGRHPSASPATGSSMVHQLEQDEVIASALLLS
ncbi:MAG: multifunctional oxoglutarate decarboxylase/oxoglutarate dehydrogenase thiamine pyrophosphate-binding subunit/dihydrolipoyllysine-residue succinyltransferase subunit [Rhodothermaceae bacterium]|nr:multifunctional oxoglutarate decarboxylase/oxoglutarate dehydrogenase thiamine pyrophosphate-binding subunit/dihydrolipoyllysine-residue succinyltransferase subunit [Bacteroidota bacterium]MXW14713.1 multifunctional oxoglutarate decarboxylase/oxoglutarate dehydrogenase thiamine pyrophosphate-binding subunit/dihydrolipoyllysine-residue succinyltransferase subunit [Rhodothermaceae bacterium]MXW33803.1 multifunctional oxoglutarate decarboxylase/oxoglutarate dehydrogenase thiamine pyrophosphate-bi